MQHYLQIKTGLILNKLENNEYTVYNKTKQKMIFYNFCKYV